jgi:hypothetical protein
VDGGPRAMLLKVGMAGLGSWTAVWGFTAYLLAQSMGECSCGHASNFPGS